MLSGRCNVKNYKVFYKYSKSNGLSSFKNMLINIWPKMRNHKINQPSFSPKVGSRTHQRYDEKRMLSEFARYITQKEQPISMDNCLSFARLVIRECGQPLYKRFDHKKMVVEIKR
jgi:hypothetical protein